jgi:hypothetical protein
MRAILIDDILALSHFLLLVPEPQRMRAVATLLAETHLADQFRKRTGRAHPQLGNGSLTSAAMMRRGSVRTGIASDLDYLAAIRAAVDGLTAWKRQQAQRGGHHADGVRQID